MKSAHPLLIVSDFLFPNYAGGGARLLHSFLKGLDRNGLDFKVVTRPPAGVYGSANAIDADYDRWRAAGKVTEARPFSWRHLRALRLASRDTALNIHHPVLGLPFALFARRRRLVYFFHGPWHEEYRVAGGGRLGYWIKKKIQVYLLRRADEIVVLSDHFGDIAGTLAEDRNKVRIIPALIEACGTAPDPGERAALRRRWGIPDDVRVFFTSRRLTPRTGVIELVRMFKASFEPETFLIIVGKGELQERLEAEIGQAKNIRFLRYVPEDDLRELMILSNLYVLPTLALEGFGMVILEAMDAGLPVVASATSGGAREYLEKIDPRLIFSMDDPESLKRAAAHAETLGPPGFWTAMAARHGLGDLSREWHQRFTAPPASTRGPAPSAEHAVASIGRKS